MTDREQKVEKFRNGGFYLTSDLLTKGLVWILGGVVAFMGNRIVDEQDSQTESITTINRKIDKLTWEVDILNRQLAEFREQSKTLAARVAELEKKSL